MADVTPQPVAPRPASGQDGGSDESAIEVRRPSRTVLMVLFHFPPLGGVAVPRNVRNVQYLPRFGWTPVVVAARDAARPTDLGLLSEVSPRTRVYRAWCPAPSDLRPVVDPLLALARILRGSRGPRADAPPGKSTAPGAAATAPGRDINRAIHAPLWMWRLRRYLSFPDGQVAWLPFALTAALRAQRRGKCDVVYSTAMPITAHLVAAIVKRLTGVPWVAEFRDPWLGNPITEALAGPHSWLHRRLQVRLERWIIRSADRIVFVSPSTTRLYRRRYPDAAEMVTITNGHDSADVTARRVDAPIHDRFRLVYTGTLRPDELYIFLAALQTVVARRPDLLGRLEVAFYGDVSHACLAVADPFVRNGALGAIVRFHGFVPRQTALAALADADAALLMLGPGRGLGQLIPSKLFDILGQDQQVLAILPPGDARDILDELGWGVIADPDVADIERALERLLALPRPTRAADPEGKYDGVALAGRLASTLRDTTDARRHARTTRSGPSAAGDLT